MPTEPVIGTITGSYVGVLERVSYYVSLDSEIELDTGTRTIRTIQQDARGFPEWGTKRRTNIISVAASEDVPAPPRDLLSPALLNSGSAEAELVDLVFRRPLPSRVDLAEQQRNMQKAFEEWDYVGIGYADIEVE